MTVWYELKELLRRVWQLENSGGNGGPGILNQTFATIGSEPATLPNSRRLAAGSNVTFVDGGAASTLTISASAGGSTSPLTTKGDIWGFSSVDARIPVGTNTYVLTANSAATLGVDWEPAASGLPTVSLQASENIAAGDWVNIYSLAGAWRVRRADATAAKAYEVHGWAPSAITSGNTGTVQLVGINTGRSGLTPGPIYLSTSAGQDTQTALTTTGQLGQQIGEALTATSAEFQWHPGILLAAAPTSAGAGVTQGQLFTVAGTYTFNVPTGVTCVLVTGIGGGSGGNSLIAAASGGGGGGAGEYVANMPVPVTSGGTATVVVGAGGVGATAGAASIQFGAAGTDSSFAGSVYTIKMKASPARTTNAGTGNSGGGSGFASGGVAANPGGVGGRGSLETPTASGGSAGGGGGSTTAASGGAGGGSQSFLGAAGSANSGGFAGGGSGASSPYGDGGAGGVGAAVGSNAATTSYGAGGGGGGGGTATLTRGGGNGMDGAVLVQWTA